ncbi:hypothetical protein D9M72_595270 [compost metagenome]
MRRNRLAHEEQVPEVDRLTFVPAFFGDAFKRLPVVAGGVVDEHVDRAERGCCHFGGPSHCVDIAQVGMNEERPVPGLGVKPVGERLA